MTHRTSHHTSPVPSNAGYNSTTSSYFCSSFFTHHSCTGTQRSLHVLNLEHLHVLVQERICTQTTEHLHTVLITAHFSMLARERQHRNRSTTKPLKLLRSHLRNASEVTNCQLLNAVRIEESNGIKVEVVDLDKVILVNTRLNKIDMYVA